MGSLRDQMVGHSQIIQRLFSAIQSGHLPSTFLFTGPSGVGKRTLAYALAQSLVCENRDQTGNACGRCGPCARLENAFRKNENTEAVLFVHPEKTQIKIDQTREILDFLSLRSISRSRVVVIDSAETLNPQAANSLLKILEEPPSDCYFFLIAPSPQHVLSTIRSRSQIVTFSPLSLTEMKQKAQAPEWALRASQGSFEKLSYFQNSDEIEARQSAIEFLRMKMNQPKAYLLQEWRDMVRGRSEAIQLARHLSLLLRDAVYYQLGNKNSLLNPDQQKTIADFAQFMTPDQLFLWAQKSLTLEPALLANRDSQLVFEEFWLS